MLGSAVHQSTKKEEIQVRYLEIVLIVALPQPTELEVAVNLPHATTLFKDIFPWDYSGSFQLGPVKFRLELFWYMSIWYGSALLATVWSKLI